MECDAKIEHVVSFLSAPRKAPPQQAWQALGLGHQAGAKMERKECEAVEVSTEILDFVNWFSAHDVVWKRKPWLVIGKGPTFSFLKEVDTTHYNTFGLNHVALETQLDVAHAIDLEVIEACADDLYRNAGHVVMPWYPHVGYRAGKHSLNRLTTRIEVLAELRRENRLIWYNREGWSSHGGAAAVKINGFSAEVPYALLGMAGVRKIRSVGVDGGKSYAKCFDSADLLANRSESFKKQFDGIARSVMTYGLDAAPLGTETPIRVYVAMTEEQLLSARVLKYSIQKHSSMTAEVIFMHESDLQIPHPRDRRNWARTPFSFQRFLIPELAGYQGRAIYLDSDMQVFEDIRELWQSDLGANHLLSVRGDGGSARTAQYSVMLLDCERLRWNVRKIVESLDSGDFSYEDLMQKMVIATKQEDLISPDWNGLEKYVKGKTKLLHYTDMDTQPWVYAHHPLGHLWIGDLLEAVDEGHIDMLEIEEHAQRGWVRPSLPYQVKHGLLDGVLLPSHILMMDRAYSAPYRKLQYQKRGMTFAVARYFRAYFRQLERAMPDLSFLRRLKRRLRF